MKTELLPDLASALRGMLDELDGSRLVVALVPQRIHTNEGGCVRVAIEKNATWYRNYCGAYASRRVRGNAAFDTKIRRENTRRALLALIAGRDGGIYGAHLLAIAQCRMRAPSALAACVAARRRQMDRAACFA